MTGMNIQTATRKIKTFLETNLTDPLAKRYGAFIYDDELRIDLDKNPFPKFFLKKKDEPSIKPLLAMGNVATENTDEIFLEIKCLAGEKYIDNEDDTKYTAEEFLGLLAQRAEDLIKLNRQYFIDNGFLHVIMTQDRIEDDKDKNPTYRMGLELKYISSPN